jgi:hypothetical protein
VPQHPDPYLGVRIVTSRNPAVEYVLEADGGSRGNPGPAAYGTVIVRAGVVVRELAAVIGVATNNVAEYRGLLAGLEWIAMETERSGEALAAHSVEARLDSARGGADVGALADQTPDRGLPIRHGVPTTGQCSRQWVCGAEAADALVNEVSMPGRRFIQAVVGS